MTYRVLDLKKEKKYVKLFVNDQKKKKNAEFHQ